MPTFIVHFPKIAAPRPPKAICINVSYIDSEYIAVPQRQIAPKNNPNSTCPRILKIISYLILTMIDIGYVQLSRPQSDAEEATNPNSLVKEADIADHP